MSNPQRSRTLHFSSRLSDASLSALCAYTPATRYATPSGHGYMSMAFIAAHRRLRRAAEGGETAGFGLFFFGSPDKEDANASTNRIDGDIDSDGSKKEEKRSSGEPLACRGFFFMREERETVTELRSLADGDGDSHQYLTLSAAPPTLLEEYLPLVRWWLPSRYAPATEPPPLVDKNEDAATCHRQGVTRMQLFLRDATNEDARSGGSDLHSTNNNNKNNNKNKNSNDSSRKLQPEEEVAMTRRRTYTALAIYNSISLLSSLPLSPTFAGLVHLKLIHFPMSSLLWDSIAKAGATLRFLNLSCCTHFTDPIALEAMRQLARTEQKSDGTVILQQQQKIKDEVGLPRESSAAVGALPHLRALLLSATDITNETLRTLVAATAPFHQLAYVNLGECAGITDISSLIRLRGALRHLFLYSLPQLEATLALEVVARAGADSLQTLCLSRCPTIRDVRKLARLGQLKLLDLQGCTGLTSLSGLLAPPPDQQRHATAGGHPDSCGCASLEKLWLTGCTSLSLTTEDQAALFATCGQLQDLQLGYALSGCKSTSGNSSVGGRAGSSFALPQSCPALQFLSLAQCDAIDSIAVAVQQQQQPPPPQSMPQPLTFPLLSCLDLSGTRITASMLSRLLFSSSASSNSGSGGGGVAADVVCQAPRLHTLALNGCRDISDFACLRVGSLRRLSIAGTRVTSGQLESIAVGCPHLEVLNLNYCDELASFSVFRLLRALHVLSLAHSKATNTALQHLVNIPFLQVLSLQETAVTDVAKLAKAPYLRLVECSAKKAVKGAALLAKAGIKVDTDAAPPPLKPPMAFVTSSSSSSARRV